MADFASALAGVPDEAVENADDASASSVEIKFLSSSPSSTQQEPQSQPITHSSSASSSNLPDLATHKISRVLVRNNGIPFRDQDWARLRKIAEGNPDESKIGAFGVGFYALWSICDSPIVLMDLVYHGRSIALTMPPPFEFSRFLATSLAFTTQIRSRPNRCQYPQMDTSVLQAKSKLAIKNAALAAATSTSSFASRMLSAFTKSSSSAPTPSSTNPSIPMIHPQTPQANYPA
ncbi:hypothetical protein KEM48_010527 [Puccinia striiformis f. sp. tritici PST-130]|nr:hypothetical protein KEM48_010527 [Puccinia striiformis f. sp. tritici PST-130]